MGKKAVFWTIGAVLLLPISSLLSLFLTFSMPLAIAVAPVFVAVMYLIFRKKLFPPLIIVNGVITGFVVLGTMILMIITKGNTGSVIMQKGVSALIVLYPGFVLLGLIKVEIAYLAAIITSVSALLCSILFQKRFIVFKKALVCFIALLLSLGTIVGYYVNRPAVRYGGHGFEYMNGYSSTDFKDYMVYSSPSKLVTLDHPASLVIEEEENMPKMDGAEACYPVYAAIAKAVYKDIATIESDFLKSDSPERGANGKIVRFTNTVQGFWSLIRKDTIDGKETYGTDLFFGARPSKEQLGYAEEYNVDLTITQIGKEAFVFFVEPDNPVENLTSDQIRSIYHGDITNWAQVGGKDQKIIAFQRPNNSGSQTIMTYFMGDVSLKEPDTFETVSPMQGIVHTVAQYNNEAGAFGYSFRYFVEDLMQENDVKVIAVDGVKPTLENIKNGSYPLTTALCLITRTDDPNPNVQKMIDYMLSPEGQEILEKTGYAGLE